MAMLACSILPGVELRLLEPRHAQEIFAVVDRHREYLRQWLPWVDGSRTAADTEAFIGQSLEQFTKGIAVALGIWQNEAYVGGIGTHPMDLDAKKAEIGYWLAPEAQGQGIVTAACRRLMQHLYEERDIRRIVIQCAVGNRKSRAVPERLGFTLEGILRRSGYVNGEHHDMALYSLLREEWNQGSRSSAA
ncbi:MAG: GNAT family protein [Bryobacteraceae bacterium]|nr:GNAT family protein [Bryobacteraceae bacterium]